MKLLLHIDQKESIRHGADAPNSTEVFDLDPNIVPAECRGFFADHFEIKSGEFRWTEACYYKYLTLSKPITTEAIIAVIRRAMETTAANEARASEDLRQQKAADEARNEAHTQAARRYVETGTGTEIAKRLVFIGKSTDGALFRSVSERKSTSSSASFWDITSSPSLTATGHFSESGSHGAEVTIPTVDTRYIPRDLAEQVWVKFETLAMAAGKPELDRREALYLDRRAQIDAKAARLRAQIDAKAAEIGGIFAERHLAGYTVDKEIIARIQADELNDRGLECGEPGLGLDESEDWKKPLTDAQFLALKDFKAKLPADATVALCHAWKTDRDNHKIDDTDTIYAETAWQAGEVTVTARAELGPVPQVETLD